MSQSLVIRGAQVLDGTGAPERIADVRVEGGLVTHIDPLVPAADEEVDGRGLVLAPGFIDVYTHDDTALITAPLMPQKVSQGVTSIVTGLCGYSPAPLRAVRQLPAEYLGVLSNDAISFETFSGFLDAIAAARPAVNYLPLVGHSSLRLSAMQDTGRAATKAEIAVMGLLLDEAMQAGAAGLSSGLAYSMAQATETQELITLSRRIKACSGLYVTHLRDEAGGMLDATREALTIGREAGVGVVFSHHKAIGEANYGKTAESLAMIDRAGLTQKVALDVYPYTYSSTVLDRARAGRGGRIVVTRSGARPDLAGRDLSDIASELELDLAGTADALHPAGALYFCMDDGDVDRVLCHPRCMIGSDGLPYDPHPHPRLWGTFPRVLGHYVRDRGLLSLADAVHRMTGLPARVFGLKGRGVIAPGHHADLVLFDSEEIADGATPSAPTTPASGIRQVWIGGKSPSIGTGQRLVSRHET